ncbi:hypothetical protein HGRIS_014966 [Hohenbuehelia grisea]
MDCWDTKESKGSLSAAVSSAKTWFRRSTIKAWDDVQQLESLIRSCRLRFLRAVSLRTEYTVLVHHREYLDWLDHFEDLVSYMLVQDQRRMQHNPSLMGGLVELDEIDYQFLHRQITRLVHAFDTRCQKSWPATMEPHRLPPKWDPVDALEILHEAFVFHRALERSLAVINKLSNGLLIFPPHQLLVGFVNLASDLAALDRHSDAGLVFTMAGKILRLPAVGCTAPSYERASAIIQYQSAVAAVQDKNPLAISFCKDAVTAWQHVFDKHGGSTDQLSLVRAISLYETRLFRHGHLEESLDYSQKSLLLLRALPEVRADDTPIVTWIASGEADVVYSHHRRISRAGYIALIETDCLWNVGRSLAVMGQYAKARVAATDAVDCLGACLTAMSLPIAYAQWLEHMRTEIPSWVSIGRNPTPSVVYAWFVCFCRRLACTMPTISMTNPETLLANDNQNYIPL